MVGRALADSNVPPQMLELELTESIAMDAPEQVIAIVRQLYDLGVQLSIDDFGTGYSSFSYIRRLKVHKLKIDQSFVRHRGEDPVRPTSCAPSSAWRKAWSGNHRRRCGDGREARCAFGTGLRHGAGLPLQPPGARRRLAGAYHSGPRGIGLRGPEVETRVTAQRKPPRFGRGGGGVS